MDMTSSPFWIYDLRFTIAVASCNRKSKSGALWANRKFWWLLYRIAAADLADNLENLRDKRCAAGIHIVLHCATAGVEIAEFD
jgi:hypothetical protein